MGNNGNGTWRVHADFKHRDPGFDEALPPQRARLPWTLSLQNRDNAGILNTGTDLIFCQSVAAAGYSELRGVQVLEFRCLGQTRIPPRLGCCLGMAFFPPTAPATGTCLDQSTALVNHKRYIRTT